MTAATPQSKSIILQEVKPLKTHQERQVSISRVPFQPVLFVLFFSLWAVVDLLRVTKRGHLPTALGPTLPSPRRGDRQDRGGGQVELWNCGKRHSAALGGTGRVGAGAVRPSGRTHNDGRRSAWYGDRPVAREITADWTDDARRRLL